MSDIGVEKAICVVRQRERKRMKDMVDTLHRIREMLLLPFEVAQPAQTSIKTSADLEMAIELFTLLYVKDELNVNPQAADPEYAKRAAACNSELEQLRLDLRRYKKKAKDINDAESDWRQLDHEYRALAGKFLLMEEALGWSSYLLGSVQTRTRRRGRPREW